MEAALKGAANQLGFKMVGDQPAQDVEAHPVVNRGKRSRAPDSDSEEEIVVDFEAPGAELQQLASALVASAENLPMGQFGQTWQAEGQVAGALTLARDLLAGVCSGSCL